jgi:hypothetical protein
LHTRLSTHKEYERRKRNISVRRFKKKSAMMKAEQAWQGEGGTESNAKIVVATGDSERGR